MKELITKLSAVAAVPLLTTTGALSSSFLTKPGKNPKPLDLEHSEFMTDSFTRSELIGYKKTEKFSL